MKIWLNFGYSGVGTLTTKLFNLARSLQILMSEQNTEGETKVQAQKQEIPSGELDPKEQADLVAQWQQTANMFNAEIKVLQQIATEKNQEIGQEMQSRLPNVLLILGLRRAARLASSEVSQVQAEKAQAFEQWKGDNKLSADSIAQATTF